MHEQRGGRGGPRRQHYHEEARNVVCGYTPRNDHVTNRFIQYALINAGEIEVLVVHDGVTRRSVVEPPQEQMWLHRRKKELIPVKANTLPVDFSLYSVNNDTDVAEDGVLFADNRDHGLSKEITNPAHIMVNSKMPMMFLNKPKKEVERMLTTSLDKLKNPYTGEAINQSNAIAATANESGSDEILYSVPPIWKAAYHAVTAGTYTEPRQALLNRVDFFIQALDLTSDQLRLHAWPLEIIERDRSYTFKDTFHLADLEPGAR